MLFSFLTKNNQARNRPPGSGREVLESLACGLSDKAIADPLHMSIWTVRLHPTNIDTKLWVISRFEAVIMGLKDTML